MSSYKKGSKSCRGIDLKVGDHVLGFGVIVKTTPGQHELGARFVDAEFDKEYTHRCWEGFRYHVECDIVITSDNATPRELLELP